MFLAVSFSPPAMSAIAGAGVAGAEPPADSDGTLRAACTARAGGLLRLPVQPGRFHPLPIGQNAEVVQAEIDAFWRS